MKERNERRNRLFNGESEVKANGIVLLKYGCSVDTDLGFQNYQKQTFSVVHIMRNQIFTNGLVDFRILIGI